MEKHTLKWQVWFEDEKCRKHNVLHQFWFLTCIHSVWRGFVAAVLLIFSVVAFICKFCKRISSIRSKDLKKPMHLPAPQKMRTELIESGQKRLIKTLSVNGNIPSLTIYDLKLKCCLAPTSTKYLLLCSTDERRSNLYGTKWGWVADDRIFRVDYFWVDYPFKNTMNLVGSMLFYL